MAYNQNLLVIDEFLGEDEDTLKDKYLTFKIANEDYAIEIKYVIEIIRIQKITRIPNIKDYIKGIINLRGIIIPVVEIRKRFNLLEIEYDDRTCIIVVMINNNSIGLIVDDVAEVIDITESNLTLPPSTNKGNQSRFIQAIGNAGEKVKIILDIHKLLYEEDLSIYETNE